VLYVTDEFWGCAVIPLMVSGSVLFAESVEVQPDGPDEMLVIVAVAVPMVDNPVTVNVPTLCAPLEVEVIEAVAPVMLYGAPISYVIVYDATLVGSAVLFAAVNVNKDEFVPKHPSAAVKLVKAYGQFTVNSPAFV
jgi:hypothetical protein